MKSFRYIFLGIMSVSCLLVAEDDVCYQEEPEDTRICPHCHRIHCQSFYDKLPEDLEDDSSSWTGKQEDPDAWPGKQEEFSDFFTH